MMSRQATPRAIEHALHHLPVARGGDLALDDVDHLAGADDAVAVGVGRLQTVPERAREARGLEEVGHVQALGGGGHGFFSRRRCVVGAGLARGGGVMACASSVY